MYERKSLSIQPWNDLWLSLPLMISWYCIDIENGLFKTERRWFLFKHKNEVAKCISFSLNLRLIWLPKQVTLYFFSEEIHKSGDATFFCQDSKYVLVWSNSDLWKSRDDINLRINFDNYLFFRAEGFFLLFPCYSQIFK